MSMPNIPNITPEISVSKDESIALLLASIALEEMALAHIMNAEAEKIQYAIGTLFTGEKEESLHEFFMVNRSTLRMMHALTIKEALIQVKFSNVMELIDYEEHPFHRYDDKDEYSKTTDDLDETL